MPRCDPGGGAIFQKTMRNLLVMDMRFEPMGDSPESLYAIPLSGFPIRYEHTRTAQAIEYQYTILFFVMESERGYVPTSAVVRSVMLRDLFTREEIVVEGWAVLQPEPIIDYFEIDVEAMIEAMRREMENGESRDSSDSESVQTIKPEPNLVQMIGDQIVRGSVNIPFDDADVFVSGVLMLVSEVQAPISDE